MTIKQNIILDGLHGKPILTDVYLDENSEKKPIVIFVHGFKGFKDWGVFDLVAQYFANSGFVFIKFNLSHNGTTVDQPSDFADLEAFSNNTFSKELDDLAVVIDWACKDHPYVPSNEKSIDDIYLIGHSRGGGIAILKANEDLRVRKLATWSSVNEFGKFWDDDVMKKWKEDGVMIVKNARTKQDMPMKYSLYDDYFANIDRLYIPAAVKSFTRPFLLIHGENDEAVNVEIAHEMKSWNNGINMKLMPGEGHTFSAKHPWDSEDLPKAYEDVVKTTVDFFRE
ncbi:MAG: prolyl oligopeptidase family serine peptidase [Chitinophagales bacterium]|nr:prolyl oligopeptidase family serine peptidase [Chitinophagales bacterium]